MALPFPPDDVRLAAHRAALPALGAGIYLDTVTAGPLPSPAAEAMAERAAWELRVGRVSGDRMAELDDRMAEARAAVAAVLTADLDDVALASSVGQVITDAVATIGLRAGERVVTTNGEPAATLARLDTLRAHAGVDVEVVDVAAPDEPTLLARFEDAIAVGTRLLVVSHVVSTIGARLPIDRITGLAHDRGALAVVDGTCAAGVIAVDAKATGADLYAIGGHAWLLGPEGVAAAWVGRQARERLRHGSLAAVATDDGAFYGPTIIGFARAVGWLSMTVGLPAAHSRGAEVARAAAARLSGIEGVTVLSPVDRMAGIVAFSIRGWSAEAALDELRSRVFALASAVPSLDAIRVCPAWFNDATELQRFMDTVGLIAAHTPATVPPRRRLEIVSGGA